MRGALPAWGKHKERAHRLINENAHVTRFVYVLIVLNVAAIIAGSYKRVNEAYGEALYAFEVFSVAVFTIEYLVRLWTADRQYAGRRAFPRIRFALSFYGLVDLLAILPFYLPLLFAFDLRVLRILRLLRLLRIFKLGRISRSMQLITEVLRETKAELLVTLFVAFVLLTLSSTLMYYVEHEAQPDKFGNIGEALWWAVVTLTTVGYGDVYPVTIFGKILSGIIALIGIGFVALPTGILSSAFIERIQLKKQTGPSSAEERKCPRCGWKIEEKEPRSHIDKNRNGAGQKGGLMK